MTREEFDLETYYDRARSGERCGDDSIVDYIKGYSRVILWGASFQGRAVARALKEKGVVIDGFWDIRYKELVEVDGLIVKEPFSTGDPQNTVVIVCIGNRVIFNSMVQNMKEHGYKNYIEGDGLYMGLICPFDCSTGIKARRCSKTMECRQIYCDRIRGIMSSKYKDNGLAFTSITLVINQVCSLKCKYCTSYMNEYKKDERVNFSLEQIKNDIDKFLTAVDYVGTITVMGGEPFLHPNISDIIEYLCQYDNFGLISIATSGTCLIKDEQLNGLYDERVNISFSNYTQSISEDQKNRFYKNIEMIKEKKICYTVGVFSPEWIIPHTLDKKNISDEEAIAKRNSCTHYDQIKNGKVHPCDFANAIYSLGIADYDSDYVDLNIESSVEELRDRLKEYRNREFYKVCKHHVRRNGEKYITAKAAEQGYHNFRG